MQKLRALYGICLLFLFSSILMWDAIACLSLVENDLVEKEKINDVENRWNMVA